MSPPAAVAGGFVVSANILETLEREALPTTAAAFGAVALIVLVLFRGRRETLWTLAALLGGTSLLAGAVVAFDIRINFLSFIAFPITFGIGVEYALNVLYRHRQDPAALATAVSGTGRAVALCSLTTIIGYGSLLLARNQALFSFGLLAVLGEICCLSVAVVALPGAAASPQRVRPASEQAVLAELVVQAAPADPEQARGHRAVVARLVEGGDDRLPLGVAAARLQRPGRRPRRGGGRARGRGGRTGAAATTGRPPRQLAHDVRGGQLVAVRQNHQPFDEVLQLAHVARPGLLLAGSRGRPAPARAGRGRWRRRTRGRSGAPAARCRSPDRAAPGSRSAAR